MDLENNILVIDAGNTSIKVAEFLNDNLVKLTRCNLSNLEDFLSSYSNNKAIVSSVLSNAETNRITKLLTKSTVVTSETPVPIPLGYSTKNTLGIDRICNAVYASQFGSSAHAVVIDVGTCVKFDLIHIEKGYLGGSISPGIDLRYKALNDYTGKLPLLSEKEQFSLVGTNTNSSISSGVINGLQGELQQFIDRYSEQFEDLTFFMTGGDARYFDLESKNDIFADRNLTLKGLYEIYKFNV